MVRGLIREGSQGKEAEPGGPGQRGRDVRWRLSGEWGRKEHGRGHAWVWTVVGMVSGLCQGVRSCWPGLGFGCGMASAGPEAIGWQH